MATCESPFTDVPGMGCYYLDPNFSGDNMKAKQRCMSLQSDLAHVGSVNLADLLQQLGCKSPANLTMIFDCD